MLLQSLFEQHATLIPDATALRAGERTCSYGELNERANKLARFLAAEGVGPEIPVAVLATRSMETIVAILAILKAGGAYVPLDPATPPERTRSILADCGAAWVLAPDAETAAQSAGRVFCLTTDWTRVSALPGKNLEPIARPENLAYIIYTSGSSGKPKGVFIEHRNICNYVQGILKTLQPQSGDNFFLVSTLAADLGYTMLYPALSSGGCLNVLSTECATDPAAFERYSAAYPADYLKITPSHFAMLQQARPHANLMPKRMLILGGEFSRSEWVSRLQESSPGCAILNHYGPTETAVGVLTYRYKPGDAVGETLPLRDCIGTTAIHVLNEDLKPVAANEPGELFIGGDSVARGYLNRPQETRSRFIADPFQSGGGRLYRTGDRARILPNGNLELLGRVDRQVKVRGYRVELSEIEHVLRQHPAVRDVCVTTRQDSAGNSEVLAYLVPDTDAAGGEAFDYHTLPNNLPVAHLNPNETEYLYHEIFELKAYQKNGIRFEPDACIFDVGANIGLFSLFASQACGSAKIYAFEPNPGVNRLLRKNAALHSLDATVFSCGVSNRSDVAPFTFFKGFSLFSGLYADSATEKNVVKNFLRNQSAAGSTDLALLIEEAEDVLTSRFESETINVPLRTLSDVIADEGIDRIDLLKINVEKSERDVLDGIREADWPKIRQLVVEVDTHENLDAIVPMLRGRGYHVAVEQDPLLVNTPLHYVYAISPVATARSKSEPVLKTQAAKPAPELQIAQWRNVYEEMYGRNDVAMADPTFNITGWNSSYTNAPLPAEEMKEWVEQTVARILKLKPRRVLEIGCGTGLLLFRVAPHCEHYRGTDFSQAGIDWLKAQLSRPQFALPHVSLQQGAADQIVAQTDETFDLIVINSVIQLFPNIEYLFGVLEGAAKLLSPNGSIFVGDVRSLPWLELQHASVELARTPENIPCSQLLRRVSRRVSQEEELVVDPQFFMALKDHFPALSDVDVQLKSGRYLNELTCFRFDATLRFGRSAPVCGTLDWKKAALSLSGLQSHLASAHPAAIRIANIPNARLINEVRALQCLKDGAAASVGELRQSLALQWPGIEPDDIEMLASQSGYDVLNEHAASGALDCFDALLVQTERWVRSKPRAGSAPAPAADWKRFANNPLLAAAERKVTAQLRGFARKKLPEHMLPTHFVVLERMPLTPNGKLNYQNLPAPAVDRSEGATLCEPQTEVEQQVAAVWAEVLGVSHIGLDEDFFELGGHSLRATRIAARLSDQLQIELPIRMIFDAPTVRQLSDFIGHGNRPVAGA